MFTALALATLLLAQADPRPAPVAAPSASPAKAIAGAEKPEKPKMVCTDEIPTGSKFTKRVCVTPEEAKANEDLARDRSEAMRACRTGMGC